ncbi:hypothetical protein [Salinibacterium sp. SWN167]|uniref:hypothetical protein n=1 Tax=Salinibacterium sp. SWN167 TaxID=2792054 RepID=UPI0018CDDCC9|nr:hypothetical protein [Salinibacterium sp. SWN167]MBH0083892.1 hypothetical protein [Salinibacterium sp. SWN167]
MSAAIPGLGARGRRCTADGLIAVKALDGNKTVSTPPYSACLGHVAPHTPPAHLG